MQYSEELIEILNYAEEEAMRTGSYEIMSDHILLGIIRHGDNCACKAISELGVELQELKGHIDGMLFRHESISYSRRGDLKPSRDAQNVMNMSAFEASSANTDAISTSHLLIALFRCTACRGAAYLKAHGIGIEDLKGKMPAQEDKAVPTAEVAIDRDISQIYNDSGHEQIMTLFSSGNKVQS